MPKFSKRHLKQIDRWGPLPAVRCGMKLTIKVGEMLENVRRKNEADWVVAYNVMNRTLVSTFATIVFIVARLASQLRKRSSMI